jgi:WD40 repeat protein
MQKHFRFLIGFLVIALPILACSSSFKVLGTPQPPAGQSSTPGVAQDELLPHTLYYSSADSTGLTQIFRMELDGKTVRQITHETVAIGLYDVSLAAGSVTYVANNQLLLINTDGSGRRVLVDGGPVDSNNSNVNSLYSPVFSPDGQTIAYAQHGLNLYNFATGVSKLVLSDESYLPEKYSPDGSKLLMRFSVPNTDATIQVIYNPATNSVMRFTSVDGAFFCCKDEWTQDSLSFYAANPTLGMLSPGLWKVDAVSGSVTTLLPSDAGNGKFNLADEPYLAPDGQLYYFFANASDTVALSDRVPLQIVRSAPDGVTGRVVLRPETFETLNEALWAPDASFVIVTRTTTDSTAGSIVELYYTDATKSMVTLLPYGQQLQWGP